MQVRPGRIELAKDEDALIIHFEVGTALWCCSTYVASPEVHTMRVMAVQTQELAVGVDGQERLLATKQGYKR